MERVRFHRKEMNNVALQQKPEKQHGTVFYEFVCASSVVFVAKKRQANERTNERKESLEKKVTGAGAHTSNMEQKNKIIFENAVFYYIIKSI